MRVRRKPYVTVIIPAVNEEKMLEKTIRETLRIKQYSIDPLVIIDTKVGNKTKEYAKKAGARIVHVGKGLGKGNAFRKAIPHIKGTYTIQIDADFQFQPREIPKLLEPLLKNIDMTLGTRYQKGASVESGSVTLVRRLGSYFLSLVTSAVTRNRITDVMAGFKGFRTDLLKELPITANHFGYEAELVVLAAKKKFRIKNIPITYKTRIEGESHVNSLKHGLLVLKTILQTAFRDEKLRSKINR